MQSTPIETLIAGVHAEMGNAHSATWSGTIRLFRLGSQLANRRAAGGRKGKAHDPARTIPQAPGGAQARVGCSCDRSRGGFVSGGQHNLSSPTIRSATPRPAATACMGRGKMNMVRTLCGAPGGPGAGPTLGPVGVRKNWLIANLLFAAALQS